MADAPKELQELAGTFDVGRGSWTALQWSWVPPDQVVELATLESDRIRLLAEAPLRYHALGLVFGHTEMPSTQYTLLELIGRSRANGRSQAELAKDLKIDARALHYQVKVLLANGLVSRTVATFYHTTKLTVRQKPSKSTAILLKLRRSGCGCCHGPLPVPACSQRTTGYSRSA